MPRAGAHRPGRRGVPGIPKHRRMVKAKLRMRRAPATPAGCAATTKTRFYLDAERGIFLVVDGIGGQAAGEKAAEIAVDRVRARLERQTGTAEQRIREAITMANNEILRAAARQSRVGRAWPACSPWRCWKTARPWWATWAIRASTRSAAARFARSPTTIRRWASARTTGEMTEAEAMRHPRRNEVFRDVGSEEHAPDDPDFIEIQRMPFEPDSALLLCSDGLSDQVPSAEILRSRGAPCRRSRSRRAGADRGGQSAPAARTTSRWWWWRARSSRRSLRRRSRSPRRRRWLLFARRRVVRCAAAGGRWPAGMVRAAPVAPAPRRAAARARGRRRARRSPPSPPRWPKPAPAIPSKCCRGEYREQVRLKAASRSAAACRVRRILRAPRLSSGPAVIAENVQDARFSGFRILADAQLPLSAGILLINSGVEIDDMEIDGAGIGVEIRGGQPSSLRANAIRRLPGRGRADHRRRRSLAFAQRLPAQQRRRPGRARWRQARRCSATCSKRTALELPPEMPWTAARAQQSVSGRCRARAGAREEEAMIAPASRKLGKYEIRQKLGRGGMADVYLAQDTEAGPPVALKLIEHSADADTRDAIEAERRGAELQARLAAIDPRVVARLRLRRHRRLLLRGHGVHRRAGPGGADAPRPAGRRVRRRCRHRRGRDAGERAQPAGRPSTARISAASCTATSSPRTSASMPAAKCACWISASPRRSRFRAG